MAANVLFVGWNNPVTAREQMALEVLQSALAFLGRQQQVRQIESFEPVLLNPHSGGINGFILVRGDLANLEAFQKTEEWKDIVFRAGWCVEGFGVITGVINEGLADAINAWQKIIASM